MKIETLKLANDIQTIISRLNLILKIQDFTKADGKIDKESIQYRIMASVDTDFRKMMELRLTELNKIFDEVNDTSIIVNDWLKNIIEPKPKEESTIELVKMPVKRTTINTCLFDHIFGKDTDKFPDCNHCKIWEECIDEHDEIKN